MILCCFLLLGTVPVGGAEAREDLHAHLQYNIWETLANIMNVSHFCLQEAYAMHGLLWDLA